MIHHARIVIRIALCLATWLPTQAASAQSILVPAGSPWKYLDNGSDQGSSWRQPTFVDDGWASGAGQFGYGDGDERTVVSYGPDAANKHITTYFRTTFYGSPSQMSAGLTLRAIRDDGLIVYLNGKEVWRDNMPAGAVTAVTRAVVSTGRENAWRPVSLPAGSLVAGVNRLAVEVHQSSRTSSDVSFDLELATLDASQAPLLTRGPYLQMGTASSMLVRWRSNVAHPGRVRYGTDPSNLVMASDERIATLDHQVVLDGLLPKTKYYYSVGTTTTPLAGDLTHFFVTAPPSGVAASTRVWVLGDSGSANIYQAAVRDAYYKYTGSRHTNLWLMLGDNAYQDGTDAEYQQAVFDVYPSMLRKAVLWPTLGNHDGHTADSATQTGPYYDIFTLPTQGQAGGVASGTEAYYSFDYGNIHFICLDSYETSRSAAGAMATWLRNDLLATSATWVVAFWHHPPYSKGSHDSDVEREMVQMRQNILPILEDGGVDLVLSGHSHSYERSFLLDGHYGTSDTLQPSMILDGGSGRGSLAYTKSPGAPLSHGGAVYAVAGSSGKRTGGALNHPAMFVSMSRLGSVVIDLTGTRLDFRFLDETGVTRDSFSLVK